MRKRPGFPDRSPTKNSQFREQLSQVVCQGYPAGDEKFNNSWS
jgi:hypothetical protein